MGDQSSAPIGVFDSGIGGLSVLRALQIELPNERFVYLADTAYAPYGERSDALVSKRTHTLARYLVQQHRVKALVVACNTATAAAMDRLRARHPRLALVGVEPAIKPAAVASQNGHIAVMATRGTVSSQRFARLLSALPTDVQCRVQACDGLASAIEAEAACSEAQASLAREQIRTLCQRYLDTLGPFGTQPGAADTLVLGCTHYVFAQEVIADILGPGVKILSTGEPVARQTKRLLSAAGILWGRVANTPACSSVCLLSTGPAAPLARAAQRWLGLTSRARTVSQATSKFKAGGFKYEVQQAKRWPKSA